MFGRHGFFLAILLVGIILYFMLRTRIGDKPETLKRVAKRFKARFRGDTLVFDAYGPKGILYRPQEATERLHTRFHFDLPAKVKVRIMTEGPWLMIRKLFGAQDIALGDPDFDSRFVIQSPDPQEVRILLNSDIRTIIRGISPDSALKIDWNDGGLYICAGKDLFSEPDALEDFITCCRSLSAHLERFTPAELTILSAHKEDVIGNCLVCTGPLDTGAVRCKKCKTLHHKECWDYFGACAIFGCGSRRTA